MQAISCYGWCKKTGGNYADLKHIKSRGYDQCAKAILGLCFFEQTPELVDQEQHGDLVFEMDGGIVGVRVQKHYYWEQFDDHATFRYKTQSGIETEWRKILIGEGPDYFLSAFKHPKDKPDTRIGRWLLLDMKPFVGFSGVYHGPFKNKINGKFDGSSLMRVQKDDFPKDALIKSGQFLTIDTYPFTQ